MGLGWKCSQWILKKLIFPRDVFNAVLFAANTEDYESHGCCQAFFFSQKSFSPFAFRNALIWSCQVTASLGFIIAFFTQWRCQPCLFHLHSAQSMSSCLLRFVKKYLVFVPNFFIRFLRLFFFFYFDIFLSHHSDEKSRSCAAPTDARSKTQFGPGAAAAASAAAAAADDSWSARAQ